MLAIFSFFGVILLVSIIRTIVTSPGSIPDEKEWDVQSESLGSDTDSAKEEIGNNFHNGKTEKRKSKRLLKE